MEALQATGYDGLLSHEIFSDRFRAGSARGVALDGQRSFIFLLDELRRKTGTPVAGLPELPPRATCLGIAFVEFAMDETAAAAFETLLRGLGFHKAGTHKTKAVTRWKQGDINLVVNREKEGFAHAFNITHGSAVCAIGLRVEDAAATVERAIKLLDQPFKQAVGPGELDMPAVRGLEGSLVYFVDASSAPTSIWDIDFHPAATDPQALDAGLLRCDHISQSMQDEEMLTWLLFYTSLLQVDKTPVRDVIDPGGIVQSQVVSTSDGCLRLVLNASQSRHTLASRFLHQLFGSGVQHIALATDDIFATAERMRANGVPLLPIPKNYYDDLEACGDLTAEEIARLRENNILYDRHGTGEYFQIYTEASEAGFFFEIVERRDYSGFGEVNAPIRLSAQTRLAPDPAIPSR